MSNWTKIRKGLWLNIDQVVKLKLEPRDRHPFAVDLLVSCADGTLTKIGSFDKQCDAERVAQELMGNIAVGKELDIPYELYCKPTPTPVEATVESRSDWYIHAGWHCIKDLASPDTVVHRIKKLKSGKYGMTTAQKPFTTHDIKKRFNTLKQAKEFVTDKISPF